MNFAQEIINLNNAGLSKAEVVERLDLQSLDVLNYIIDSSGITWSPNRGSSPKYVVNGVLDSITGHADRLGISVFAVRAKISSSKSANDSIVIDASSVNQKAAPVSIAEARKFLDLRLSGHTAAEASEIVGRPYNTLKNAAKKFIANYDDLLKAAASPPKNPKYLHRKRLKAQRVQESAA